jgi:hypothetical protein
MLRGKVTQPGRSMVVLEDFTRVTELVVGVVGVRGMVGLDWRDDENTTRF